MLHYLCLHFWGSVYHRLTSINITNREPEIYFDISNTNAEYEFALSLSVGQAAGEWNFSNNSFVTVVVDSRASG